LKDSEWNDAQLKGPLVPGSIIQFEGVPIAFTKEPFMLTFGVSIASQSRLLQKAGSRR